MARGLLSYVGTAGHLKELLATYPVQKIGRCVSCKVHFKKDDMYDGMMCYECVKAEDHDHFGSEEDGCDVCMWLWENKHLA